MTDPQDLEDIAIAAALRQAEAAGWRALTLAQVAVAAELPLVAVYRAFPTKAHLLSAIIARIDRAMLAGGEADPADSPRDRLFEVLMRRFDALSANRAGILAVLRDLRIDPLGQLVALGALQKAMRWALAAAGIPAAGPLGAAKIHVLIALYGAVLRVWMRDDTPDLARTMAALDRQLRRAEQLANSVGGRPRSGAKADSAPDSGGTSPAD